MENFYEFMKERILKMERKKGNCVGASLYITGEIASESYFSRKDAQLKFSRLKNSYKPDLGYIALWESDGILFHAGVISNIDPLKIVHRNEINGLLTEHALDELIDRIYKNTHLKPVYKIPNMLKEIKSDPQI
jgi:hypothetical protein